MARFKDKVKAITRRNSPVNVARVIKDLNPMLSVDIGVLPQVA